MRAWARLKRDKRGTVAPTVALSLIALLATSGIAFDYARLASMDTELHDAADQAALAAASQLDGQGGAITRAKAAAQNLVVNFSRFANDSTNHAVTIPTLTFYDGYDSASDTYGAVTTSDAAAKVVKVAVGGRSASYALTPIVQAFSSGIDGAEAVAGLGSAICKVPPVMICNPNEPAANADENFPFVPTAGAGLHLITGDATAPGNFGWLQANVGNGASALGAALGYNKPPGDCQPITNVTTKPGMTASVLNAFNTRFDIYANGNSACPSQFGGICSPPINTRKDLICGPDNANLSCQTNWALPAKPYVLPTQSPRNATVQQPLPSDGSQDPTIMGYPHDLCHAWPIGSQTCGIEGDGNWDRDAYFRVNYNWRTSGAWRSATGLLASPSRFQVYEWELAHPSVVNGGKNYGIAQPQINGKEAAFSYPAMGRGGIGASNIQPDRRRLSLAVLNCLALSVHGKSTNVPVATWLDIFLIEPAFPRSYNGNAYTSTKDIYVEEIGATTAGGGQVVRRDRPYLIQ